jgi:hypothetical protein
MAPVSDGLPQMALPQMPLPQMPLPQPRRSMMVALASPPPSHIVRSP